MRNAVSLNHLPADIWIFIVEYLFDPYDLQALRDTASLALTSKKLRATMRGISLLDKMLQYALDIMTIHHSESVANLKLDDALMKVFQDRFEMNTRPVVDQQFGYVSLPESHNHALLFYVARQTVKNKAALHQLLEKHPVVLSEIRTACIPGNDALAEPYRTYYKRTGRLMFICLIITMFNCLTLYSLVAMNEVCPSDSVCSYVWTGAVMTAILAPILAAAGLGLHRAPKLFKKGLAATHALDASIRQSFPRLRWHPLELKPENSSDNTRNATLWARANTPATLEQGDIANEMEQSIAPLLSLMHGN